MIIHFMAVSFKSKIYSLSCHSEEDKSPPHLSTGSKEIKTRNCVIISP